MSIITTTSTDAKAPAWLNLDRLVGPSIRSLFDDLASEAETVCYEQEDLLTRARGALMLAEQLMADACRDVDDVIGAEGRALHDGLLALVGHVSGANRLRCAMRHLSDGFDPENETDWTPGGFRKEGENR